ncbi:MAG: hypothetical protein PHF20_04360 [Halothiobacillaceae bacterium]|nr:hypothetical protein [Halothiobacillaceae bacterium]
MTIKALVAHIKASNANLSSIPDAQAIRLLREAFKKIREDLADAKDASLTVASLGSFNMREIKRDDGKGGEKVVQRYMFRPAKDKAETEHESV